MVRISVIYGTGMTNIPTLYSKSLDSSLVSVRCETEWGNIPLTLISENDFQISFLSSPSFESMIKLLLLIRLNIEETYMLLQAPLLIL